MSRSGLGVARFEEAHPWGVALYVEVRTEGAREVTVCRHPSYVAVESPEELAERVYGAEGDEMATAVAITRILDNVLPEWKRDFEIVMRRGFVALTVYL